MSMGTRLRRGGGVVMFLPSTDRLVEYSLGMTMQGEKKITLVISDISLSLPLDPIFYSLA